MASYRAAFTRPTRAATAAAAALLAAFAAPAFAQGFAPGFYAYQPDNFRWGITGISDDGTTVTGFTRSTTSNAINGFTIQSSGVQHFPEVSRAYDASDNGAYTVGYATRRAANGVTQTLIGNTQPENTYGGGYISGDAQTVVGITEFEFGGSVLAVSPWRWTATGGVTNLDSYRPNALITRATNISRDGSTIVGTGSDFVFGDVTEAWTWRDGQGYTILPDVQGALFSYSQARATNADGTLVVGFGTSGQGRQHAVVWVGTDPTALPAPLGYRDSDAVAIADDGSIVAGTLSGSLAGLPETGAVWTSTTGWVPLIDYIRSQGIDVPSYYRSVGQLAMSADGRTFAGITVDSRSGVAVSFVASVPTPSATMLMLVFGAMTCRARARR
jgi:uncharacterized membrane protein